MARQDRRVGYGLPLLLAIGLHLAILVASVLRFPDEEVAPPSTSIVQATLVSTETTTDQAQRAEEARARADARQAEEEEEAARAEQEAARQAEEMEEEAARQAETEAQRQAEAEAREAARREAEEEAARRAAEAEAQAREREAQAERRRQAEAEAERVRQAEAEAEAEAERKRQAEAEAERKRQAEAEAERKRQAEAEAERKRQAEAEAERKRQAEEAARRAAEAASQGLDRAIEGESDNVANARQATEAANSFITLVRRAVEQAWVIPPNVPAGAAAQVTVRLGPSGELFAASIGQSSGDGAFDRSAIQAVEAAAPFAELRQLPTAVQRDYRQFNLRFRPGDIR
ncbi:cell envelope integrity protein TolA [Halomonas saccharevitans]|uniref:Cell envelope integrity protein TolA n=1 Tax=Halomonas saccharevitans TaxID=416872 RepID=A0ABU3NAD3_9GAMM|nr:cell envelope integrity protein TolA [Halomonas saccharevitans]MDT8878149.1 cell envelope integrity protein TolA [Halomonas saccharevitans]